MLIKMHAHLGIMSLMIQGLFYQKHIKLKFSNNCVRKKL